jgi:FMN reductase
MGKQAEVLFLSEVVMKSAVVVGNPKAQSRTLEAGILVAEKLGGAKPSVVVDVIELGAGLLGYGDPKVMAAIESLKGMDFVVFASPTYKATYTGLIKLFLDNVPQDGFVGMTAFPVMMGAGPAHLLAPELLFKPVLVELGATCPMVGLYLMEKTYTEDPRLDAWVERAKAWF